MEKVREFEEGFHPFMRERYPEIGEKIRRERELSKETEAALRKAVEEYKARFKEAHGL